MPRAEALVPRLVATVRVVSSLPRERRTPFLDEAQIAAIRDRRLRALVTHASEFVPYYRELFRRRGIDPREIRTVDDLRALPLLDKETVQREPDRFRSFAAAAARAVPFPTSGSTGTPLEVWHEPRALLRYLAAGERERDVTRRLLGKRRFRTVAIGHPGSTATRARAFYRRATFLPPRPRRRRLMTRDSLETIVEVVNTARPDVLGGYGFYLEWLFRQVASEAIDMRLPRLVRYYSTSLSEDGRRLIERQLGVPVVSTYGAVETFGIGFTCEERRGFHLHDDLCHVRVVSEDGTDAGVGEPGEVVVTNLVNRGMVLLNHRLGDVAALGPGRCPCGRTSRVLRALEGRVSEIVHLRSGKLVHPGNVSDVLGVNGLLRFRLVQEERERFRLDVVAVDDAAYRRLGDALPALRALLEGAEIDVVRSDAVDRVPGRKDRRVVALPAARTD